MSGLTTSLSSYVNLPTIALCNTLSSVRCGHCHPSQQQGSSLSGSDVVDAGPGSPAQPEVADWSEGMQVPSVPIQQFPIEDWNAQPATEDWSAAPTAQATEWVGTTTEWS